MGEVILTMEGNIEIDTQLRQGELGLHPEGDLTTQKFKKILLYMESWVVITRSLFNIPDTDN